jgi:hypothetical protein
VEKSVINRLLDFWGVLDNFEINCTFVMIVFLIILTRLAVIFVAIKKVHSWTSSTREISIATKIRASS